MYWNEVGPKKVINDGQIGFRSFKRYFCHLVSDFGLASGQVQIEPEGCHLILPAVDHVVHRLNAVGVLVALGEAAACHRVNLAAVGLVQLPGDSLVFVKLDGFITPETRM